MEAIPYTLSNVWQAMTPELGEEITRFWLHHHALPSEDAARKRLPQVCLIARNPQGKLIGISTAYKQHNKQLDNYFYYMRAFVEPDSRDLDIGRVFTRGIRDFFEERFIRGEDQEAIGIFLEIENPFFKRHRREAILSDTGFIFVGKNERGDHLRVYYFQGAQI
ncbi:MAG: hypothetical protein EP312_00725 [Gammaproteobacteria bacterium]|nr:MAG: hypothetical protein EP312_00725 [Gammaproteobacteria bacterium]